VKSVVVEYGFASGAASAGKLRLAALDRPADAAAVDVAAGVRVLFSGLLQEVVGGGERRILEVLEGAAGELVGAAPGHAVDDDARRSAVLGAVLAWPLALKLAALERPRTARSIAP
jgi:hypothetical protein